MSERDPAACVRLRLREQARRDARLIARWQLRMETAIILAAALWVVLEAIAGACARGPA